MPVFLHGKWVKSDQFFEACTDDFSYSEGLSGADFGQDDLAFQLKSSQLAHMVDGLFQLLSLSFFSLDGG